MSPTSGPSSASPAPLSSPSYRACSSPESSPPPPRRRQPIDHAERRGRNGSGWRGGQSTPPPPSHSSTLLVDDLRRSELRRPTIVARQLRMARVIAGELLHRTRPRSSQPQESSRSQRPSQYPLATLTAALQQCKRTSMIW